ncbi:MAG: ABC transporter permease [Chloroflexi bacterium]|nr:MAG: ABC transporter permease [Chloroflexota bacterium]
MLRTLGQLTGLLVTLLIASFVIFGALYIAPGSPIAFLTRGRSVSPATISELEAHYHLNQSFIIQYWDWLSAVLHGNLGNSIIFGLPVSSLITPRVATTVILVLYAWVIIVVSGVVLGALAGLRGRWVDRLVSVTTTVGLAVPIFVAAIVLLAVFAVGLGWFPTFGAGTGIPDRLRHLTLPAVALAISGSAYVARVSRIAVKDTDQQEFVDTARVRGLPEHHVVTHHVFRNALIPITTVTGITIASLLVGTVVIEPAFGLNGTAGRVDCLNSGELV